MLKNKTSVSVIKWTFWIANTILSCGDTIILTITTVYRVVTDFDLNAFVFW